MLIGNSQKMISGVCGSIAEYFDIDPTIVRILFVILGFSGESGILLYSGSDYYTGCSAFGRYFIYADLRRLESDG